MTRCFSIYMKFDMNLIVKIALDNYDFVNGCWPIGLYHFIGDFYMYTILFNLPFKLI